MSWKTKAYILKTSSMLPEFVRYRMQRHFGGLKKPYNPAAGLAAGMDIVKKIMRAGESPEGKVFFEVGTGWVPLVPLTLWLAGAKQIITVDLNRYLREELIRESLYRMNCDKSLIFSNMSGGGVNSRFDELMEFCRTKKFNLQKFFDLCHITYMAPCDAAKTGLPDKSVDYHVSNAVFEHIPLNILKDILKEGNRIVKKEGLFIHNIDYSDHFAYDDKNISAINFLQYSDKEWKKIAGNRHAYVNRLRHDDFISLFESAGHEFLQVETQKEDQQRVKELLEQGNIRLDERFKPKTNEILSITVGAFVSAKKV